MIWLFTLNNFSTSPSTPLPCLSFRDPCFKFPTIQWQPDFLKWKLGHTVMHVIPGMGMLRKISQTCKGSDDIVQHIGCTAKKKQPIMRPKAATKQMENTFQGFEFAVNGKNSIWNKFFEGDGTHSALSSSLLFTNCLHTNGLIGYLHKESSHPSLGQLSSTRAFPSLVSVLLCTPLSKAIRVNRHWSAAARRLCWMLTIQICSYRKKEENPTATFSSMKHLPKHILLIRLESMCKIWHLRRARWPESCISNTQLLLQMGSSLKEGILYHPLWEVICHILSWML